jgi:hypothetical protein
VADIVADNLAFKGYPTRIAREETHVENIQTSLIKICVSRWRIATSGGDCNPPAFPALLML